MNYNYGDNLGFARNKSPDVFKEYIYAEKNVHIHPYVTLSRLRTIYEKYTDDIIEALHIPCRVSAPLQEQLKLLRGKIPDNFLRKLEAIRPICNSAVHELMTSGDNSRDEITKTAMDGLRLARDYAPWFYEKVEKHSDLSQVGEFVAPPLSSLEDELRYAHDGDGWAALMVAKRHFALTLEAAESAESSFHRRLADTFLQHACDKGLYEARRFKSTQLIYSAASMDDIKAGIAIIDELIVQGDVEGLYCDKACAFSAMNRQLTGVSIARKGVEAGDPYAMNLLAQWAGYPDKKISMTDEERTKLLEKSLGIAFNCEAAYYLSTYYQSQGKVSEAIALLEQAIRYGEDKRGLVEFALGSMLVEQDNDIERGFELLTYYASKSYWNALNTAEKLVDISRYAEALAFFKMAVTHATDLEIREGIAHFTAVRDALQEHENLQDADLNFLIACLGD